MAQSGLKINYSKNIDFKIINHVIDKQEAVANQIMVSYSGDDAPTLKPILFIFDDVMHDKVMKSFQSELAGFSMRCRHYNISMIILTQKWQNIPNTI